MHSVKSLMTPLLVPVYQILLTLLQTADLNASAIVNVPRIKRVSIRGVRTLVLILVELMRNVEQ